MTQDAGWGGGAQGGGPPGGYGPYGGGGPPYGGGTPPPYGGQPPYGGSPPPYGSGPPPDWGGWSRPRGPKPGVIPLSPLTLGEILSGAFQTLGRHWQQVLGIAVAVYGTALLVSVGAVAVAYAAVGDRLSAVVDTPDDSTPAWADLRPLVIAFVCLWIVVTAAMLLATSMMQACCPVIVQEAVLGRPVRVGPTLLRALSRVAAVAGTVFLSGLIALVPVLLFIAGVVSTIVTVIALGAWDPAGWLIPLGFLGALILTPLAIWLWVQFSLAPAVVVVESRGPVDALRRSAELVRGSWWRICGISLLAFVIASVAGLVLQQLLNVLGMFPSAFGFGSEEFRHEPTTSEIFITASGYLIVVLVSQLVSQIFSTTFPQLVLNLLYIDQRIRTEDLAPALISAASTAPTAPAAPPGGP
ncbi:hypothetical protein ACIBLA_11015 [Streptomyces sp. NPDC050433]|uniref:DUF7847 domain-containing protein n=1 Tax=Streptomyces sp. NPDC050433 TaxID=3365615 RepID=UPI0037BD55D3